jgi:hypothetical protein
VARAHRVCHGCFWAEAKAAEAKAAEGARGCGGPCAVREGRGRAGRRVGRCEGLCARRVHHGGGVVRRRSEARLSPVT